MKREELYEKKKRCEITIEEIRFEISQVESYPNSPSKQKKLDRLDIEKIALWQKFKPLQKLKRVYLQIAHITELKKCFKRIWNAFLIILASRKPT